ncbi:C1 family peptidase [Caviibacter abscessus]|uniref:C1 family peptidase n=1 Tax=Caviibacter abscessus TaxID=1766719 RepID=UPI00083051DB|nr:C1 family peptidase [Caviibacter abscessus]
MQKSIELNDIEKYSKSYDKKDLKSFQNAVLKNGIKNAAFNNDATIRDIHVYSENIETGKVSNQKSSGRCWMFAALNTFRHKLNKDFNMPEFELSQTYTFFWDKLEKSNYFLESIIKTADEDLDSRLVHHLLAIPQQDGGQWDMLVSIIQKYGVVPKSIMPEVFQSTSSMVMNDLLNKKLRKNAHILRTKRAEGLTVEKLQEIKEEMLDEIYTFLCVSLGEPPKTFDFEYYDKDGKFHRDLALTPKDFYEKYVGINLDEYISLINAPTKDKPYHRTFTVDYLGNVIGGKQIKYLNVTMDELKAAAISQIQDGVSVWFGCDVGQRSDRELGLLDSNVYEFEKGYGIDFNMTKEVTLDYCESLMTHAMVLSGVNILDGKSNRWKVENSWGETPGNKGYFLMTDEWMDRFTYQVVVNKKYLPEELRKLIEQEPIVLKPWDPMGSLAIMK